MKIVAIAAALTALVGAAPGLVAPAAAQHTVVTRTVVHHAGPARAWHTRRVCTNRWVHHRRVRTCRTVRYR